MQLFEASLLISTPCGCKTWHVEVTASFMFCHFCFVVSSSSSSYRAWNLLERVTFNSSCFQVSFSVEVLLRWRWLGPHVQVFSSFSFNRLTRR
ncbi:hypothetical protein DPMN_012774 [Dreissena polymorpha]|uniref:Uncharacterized protein n=1 Tax=Dreissena polymorpha TaxID=45954 RepID=A0A9D4S186_DREPO|nr:hypothetical protein DPMN_012774 [Dreissena polymorpha]